MTELVASVRLKADGSGLVGQARESAAAVRGIGTAAAEAGTGAKALAGATGTAETGARGLAGAAAVADKAVGQLGAAAGEMAGEQRQAAAAMGVLEGRIGTSNTAFRVGAAEANRHAFGLRNLGQQAGDMAVMIQGGIDPIRAFATQAGQMGYALSEMGGKAGAVGAFLTGPWGIALTIAATSLAPFVAQLFEGGKAADEQRDRLAQAATAADSYGTAQALLGKVIDLTTGKLKTQNGVLIETIKLQAQASLIDAQKRIDAAKPDPGVRLRSPAPLRGGAMGVGGVGDIDRAVAAGAFSDRQQQFVDLSTRDLLAAVNNDGLARSDSKSYGAAIDQQLAKTIGQLDRIAVSGKVAGASLDDTKLKFIQLATAGRDKAAALDAITAIAGGGISDGLRPYERPKKTRTPKAKSTAPLEEFGRDAADRIAGLTQRFDQTPEALRRANQEVRQLDDLIDDLNRKKPVGFEKLVASAEAAKVTIRSGLVDGITEAFAKPRTLADQAKAAFTQLDAVAADLEKRRPPGYEQAIAAVERGRDVVREALVRPFDEYFEAQDQSLQIGQLIAAGQNDQADALRTIVQLERQMGPLTDAQKAAVLATTQALSAQERQIERLHRRQQVYLNAIGDVQAIVRQTIFDGPAGIKELPGRLADAFKQFAAERLTENLFGGVFEQLRDQVTGTSVVEDASTRMATALDAAGRPLGGATAALDKLTVAATGAATAVATPGGFGVTRDAASGITSDLLGNPKAAGQIGAALDEIVVVGKRLPAAVKDPFGSSLGQIATVLGKKIGIDDAKAEKIGLFIGGTASKGLKGAVEGQAAASVAGLFGLKTSGTGASIGGAIGGLTGLPGGALIGGLLGGVVGGLFKASKTGSATIGAVDGQAGVSGTSGNSASYRAAASGMGSAIADSINDIVQQLGGTLGTFAVSIGQRVDNSGRGSTKYGKANDGITAYKTAEEARAAALADALADGAVKGVSTAVAKALQSSTDVSKAVNEALKVQQLETLLGGVSGQLSAVFRQFDAEAAERVRLAKKYGLDLLQVEKVNGEQRAALVDQQLAASTGSLKDLLTSLTSGDLFEGTATERRDNIRAELAKAQADAEQGVAGANDRVAQLLGQLVTTSKEAFGTAGPELSTDRAYAAAEAARLIKIEEDRVRAAASEQTATTKAIETGNNLANEANDILADSRALLQRMTAALEQQSSLRVTPNYSLVTY